MKGYPRAPLGVFLLVLVLSGNPGTAQDAPEPPRRAILLVQADRGTGIPVLPANRITYFRAAYAVGTDRIDVYIVLPPEESAGSTELPGAWDPYACSGVGVQQLRGVRSSIDTVVRFSPVSGTMVICRGPADAAYWCRFLQEFDNQYRFFVDALGDDPVPPVPAVLDLS